MFKMNLTEDDKGIINEALAALSGLLSHKDPDIQAEIRNHFRTRELDIERIRIKLEL